jgi:hypothetical protein
MPYIAHNPALYLNKSVGTGQCVAYVQRAANAPYTGQWRPGVQVMTAAPGSIVKGTVIATLVDGVYPNHAHGNHAAIYLSHDSHGIRVMDQWTGHPVSERTINNNHGNGSASNDASKFYVVE